MYNSFSEEIKFNKALDLLLEDSVNEEFGVTAIIGTLLASGKFIELVGKLGKWLFNKMVDKGIIKGKKIEKTQFEKAGEFVNSIIHKIFMVAAKGIAKVFPMKDENVEKLANILFYTSLMFLGAQGVVEIVSSQGGGIAIIIEQIAVSIKSIELGEVLMALILMMSYEELKKAKLQSVAHSMVDCLGDNKISHLFKKDGREGVVKCTIGKVQSH